MAYPTDPKYVPVLGIDNVNPSGTRLVIDQTIEYTRSYADEMRVLLTDSIENLNELVSTYNPVITDIDTSVGEIDSPAMPNSPSFPPLILDDSWPDGIGPAPVQMDYGDIDFTFVAPEPPAEISANFSWEQSEYTSDMWLTLFNKVYLGIIDGGSGLDPAVHAAIVERSREAGRVARNREYVNALDAVGESGFNLASGRVASMQIELAREVIAKEQDENNNLLIKDFDLAVANNQFMIKSGIELEKFSRETYQTAEALSLDAAKASKDFVVAVYDANIKAYIAKWEGVRNKLEALKSKIDAISSYNDGNIKVFLSKAEVFKSEIEAISSKNKSIVDTRTGEIQAYSAEIEAVSKQYGMLIDEAKLNLESARIDIDKAIEESKLNLQAYSDKTSLAEKVAEATSQIASQSVASALGAINTTIGSSYTASDKRSESINHQQSLKESHNYQEDTPVLV